MFVNIAHLLQSKNSILQKKKFFLVLPNVIVILPLNSLFIAVNLSFLSTDISYIRKCNLCNHLFQQIRVPDLDITPQRYYENPRKREFCHLFICRVLFKLCEP